MSRHTLTRLGAVAAAVAAVATPAVAHAAGYPSDTAKPDLVPILSGYNGLWASTGVNDLHGKVLDAGTLAANDQLTSWINQNATPAERFLALQDAEYNNATGTAYDQSLTVSTGLGEKLGALYVQGVQSGKLPLTTALVNSSTGTTGAYVSTSAAKAAFSYPRPYIQADPAATAVDGDAAGCAPSIVNSSSVAANRIGKPYADGKGNLKITRVATNTDTTHQFSPNDVTLDPGYGTTGICTGGSFPSGHTTTAYQAGITLATLVPELAPELLARASEAGNDRIVLGVHYPIDIIGGRIDGEVALATRWADPAFRTEVLEPARRELVSYLQQACGGSILSCYAASKPYTSNPYGGKAIPGGTSQVVVGRSSALRTYTERLTYGLPKVSATGQAPSVPANASSLLLTAFPGLTDAQRTSVLAQTEIPSGSPLDATGTPAGSWQRLNLAQAISATVIKQCNGTVNVVGYGGSAQVIGLPNWLCTLLRW